MNGAAGVGPRPRRLPGVVTTTPDEPDQQPEHDQDAEPTTPFGEEPDTTQLDPDSEPASDPDPEPGAST